MLNYFVVVESRNRTLNSITNTQINLSPEQAIQLSDELSGDNKKSCLKHRRTIKNTNKQTNKKTKCTWNINSWTEMRGYFIPKHFNGIVQTIINRTMVAVLKYYLFLGILRENFFIAGVTFSSKKNLLCVSRCYSNNTFFLFIYLIWTGMGKTHRNFFVKSQNVTIIIFVDLLFLSFLQLLYTSSALNRW